jgi:dTDP-glucose 4,6-dehydratase
MRIAVVTGGGGFIGLNLVLTLLKNNWFVYVIDSATYVSDVQALTNLQTDPKFKWINAKINEISWIPECDVVFNLAAESHVDNSIESSASFIDSNIHGVRNLLEIIDNNITRSTDKPLFFHFSTDEVYGDQIEGQVTEDSPLNPSNPYSTTKAAADMLIKSWARTHGLEFIIVRPSNNYGKYQYPEKFLPLAVKRLSRGKKIKLHNLGTPIRTWTHVNDTISAVLLLYEKADRNRIYNISSEFEQTNLDTARKIVNTYYMGSPKRDVPKFEMHIDTSYKRPGQDVRYALRCDYLKQYGWQPTKKFDNEIIGLVKYYKERFIW